MSAFKAYDIRGIYNTDFNGETVYRIGRELPALLGATCVLVGRDARESSPELHNELIRGILESGCNVDDMGLATTPMVYFETGRKEYDASVQITASHNPPEYNGLKISRRGVLPVGYDSQPGLRELEARIATPPPPPSAQRGQLRIIDTREPYLDFLRGHMPDISGLKVAIDCSNGMAGLLVPHLFGPDVLSIYDEIDGTFPNHSPNPLEEENCRDLMELVRNRHLDLGIIFDGDADRVMFVDENGAFIRPDLLIAVIAARYLEDEPEATILHDIRTSRGVSEAIIARGGKPCMWKVGHAFAKPKMREVNAIFGGELAGHYYFREFYCCDSGMLAALIALDVFAEERRKGRTVSQVMAALNPYANSGECNFRVSDKPAAMAAVKAYAEASGSPSACFDFDGYRIEFPDWWLNVRPSNTEPYLRLLVEAQTQEILDMRLSDLRSVIGAYTLQPEA